MSKAASVRHPSEHDEQAALVACCKLHAPLRPVLATIYAIPNAGKRSVRMAAWYKAEGLRTGMLDLCLPCPGVDGSHALYIEMKAKRGRLSPEQADWIARLDAAGNRVVVCYGFEQAWQAICRHVGLEVTG